MANAPSIPVSPVSTSANPRRPLYRLPASSTGDEAIDANVDIEDEWMLPLLRQNASWFCRLRWMVVGVLCVIGLASLFPNLQSLLGISLAPAWPFLTASILTVLNLVFTRLAHHTAPAGTGGWSVRRQLWAQIGTDLLVLTAVIYGLGGGLVSASFMYLFHIILACIVFPVGESLGVVALAISCQLTLLGLKSMGILLGEPATVNSATMPPRAFDPVASTYEAVVTLLIWLSIWYLASELSRRLRRRDRDLALTNRRLEASLDERTAHMLQTTHQLKAPFAAIHAHAQLLLGGHCGQLTDSAHGVAEKISSRCLALSRQIQEMLQLANLRSRGQHTPPVEELDLANLVELAVSRIEPAARQRGIRVRKRIAPLHLQAVRDHVTMLLDNLLSNAVDYSFDNGLIRVLCAATPDQSALIAVRDQGIGIPEGKLPHVFDDYYRTDEAVRHNRASSGLGLAVVRQVAHKAGINLEVTSTPGWGSRFVTRIPLAPINTPTANRNQPHSHALSTNR